jgi:hypothetical protein
VLLPSTGEYRRSGRADLEDVPAQIPGDEQASNQALGCGTDNDSARLGHDLEPSRTKQGERALTHSTTEKEHSP